MAHNGFGGEVELTFNLVFQEPDALLQLPVEGHEFLVALL